MQNDLYLIIEGKTSENRQIVYFISYENEQYNVVDIFTGDYSVFINRTKPDHNTYIRKSDFLYFYIVLFEKTDNPVMIFYLKSV